MATKKIDKIKLLQKLKSLNKAYFTVADLEKVLGMERDALYVTLNRLVGSGVLKRLKRGIYQAEFQDLELEKVANELYYPSYLSFESALSRYGILSQMPYTLTFATTKRSKKTTLADREVEYRQIKSTYFFGYKLKDGIYVAEPEKAVLDQLYMISKGKVSSDVSEWSLVGLEKSKLLQYSKRFPAAIQKTAQEMIPKLGRHVVTLKKKEEF
jgi:predicted transcriptional regulator of viral defense system